MTLGLPLHIFMSMLLRMVTSTIGKPVPPDLVVAIVSLYILAVMGVLTYILLPSRHGRKHELYPSSVNYRANLYALRQEGCSHVIVTTACGSLKEEYQPGDIVIIDSFIDR